MWLRLAVRRQLLLAVITILLRNTVIAETQHIATLTKFASSVITEPLTGAPPHSSANAEPLPKTQLVETRYTSYSNKQLVTNKYSIISKGIKDIMVNSTAVLYASEPNLDQSGKRAEISARISSEVKMASSAYLVESGPHTIVHDKSKIIVTSTIPVENSTSHITEAENKRDENVIVSMDSEESKIMMKTTTSASPKQSLYISAALEIPPNSVKSRIINITATTLPMRQSTNGTKEDVSFIFNRENIANISYTKTEVSASYFENVSEEPHTGISSVEVKQANKTAVLEPSPSLVAKQNRSKMNMVFTVPTPNMTEQSYNKMSNSGVFPAANDTRAQYSKFKSALLTYNDTMKIDATKEKWPGNTITLNESKTININITKEMETKVKPILTKINLGNITMSSRVVKFEDETSIVSLMRFISSSYVPSDIPATANRTMMASNVAISSQFSKIFSNQTQILDNFTTYGVVRPANTVSSFYKTVTNRTGEIQVLYSGTITKKPPAIHTSVSSYSMKKIEISDTIVEIKPTSIVLMTYSTVQHSTRVPTKPTSSPTKPKEQQFRVTIKIISETFKEKYVTSARAFRKKSREIADELDQVFKNMPEYLYTEVLSFFSGSLGCNVVIHTESEQSQPVSVEEIQNTLDQAKRTKGGFGKFDVGDISDVKEKDPNVLGTDQDEDKRETWGRVPVIVISVLGGICLVLLVIVISQCVSKTRFNFLKLRCVSIHFRPNCLTRMH